jgi:hypothetical protein
LLLPVINILYSTQPTVTKLAEDRAEQYKREPDKVVKELEKRLRADLLNTGAFSRVHPLPETGHEVPDDMDARLVVLSVDHPCNKEAGSAAEITAKAILETRGNTPRLFRNSLVFLAVDQSRLQDLDEAVRRYLAWESILLEQSTLDLTPHQVKQAETQQKSANGVVDSRIPEAYLWLLVPVQASPQAAIEWHSFRLSGQGPLAERASKKLRNDALLYTSYAGTLLKMELDRVPLWRGDNVSIQQLQEDYARYMYLPRLRESEVLFRAIRDGLGLLTWNKDSFAYADSFDEALGRYRGLRCGQIVNVSKDNSSGRLVKPEIALKQQEAETKASASSPATADGKGGIQSTEQKLSQTAGGAPGPREVPKPRRYHGSVDLDPARVGRDAGRVADEVIAHLAALVGSSVRVTLEIQADIPTGASDSVVRTVTENSRTLKFLSYGFEEE